MARRLRIDRHLRPEPAAPLRGFECLRCLKSQPHQSARQDETRRQLQACCFSGPPIRAGALELEIITVVVLRVYWTNRARPFIDAAKRTSLLQLTAGRAVEILPLISSLSCTKLNVSNC